LAVLGNFYFFRKAKTLEAQVQSKMLLSKQEQKVLDLILQDKSNKEIAVELFVSNSTVKTQINNLNKKLQVNSRDEVKMMY
jgi:DNA-binding CsgD family transcriptional regulator